jgi:hypothetical protein
VAKKRKPSVEQRVANLARRLLGDQRKGKVFLYVWEPEVERQPWKRWVVLVRLGAALIYDKPIIIVAARGAVIPANLHRVATAVEYYDVENPRAMQQATSRALQAVGVIVPALLLLSTLWPVL